MDRNEKTPRKTAMITGISGQDGAYLADLLLRKGYRVVGTTRDLHGNEFHNLKALKLFERVELHELALTEYASVAAALERLRPDEIYHLSAQSSVAQSFLQPHETIRFSADSAMNLLEAVRLVLPSAKLFNSTSSECFGNTPEGGASETTPFSPLSPYAVGKAAAHLMVETYRNAFGLFCCSGILFNHESALRPQRYVTRKIVEGARNIAAGGKEPLRLGNIEIMRDWGLASEYVDAMWLMLQQPTAADYVIATGKASPLKDFLHLAFAHFGLRWQDHVVTDDSLLRSRDIRFTIGNPAKAHEKLGWKARSGVPEVVASMIGGSSGSIPAAEKKAPQFS